MALDPVPWLVAGGAVHSSEVSRVLPYVAAGGAQGVAGASDCAVKALVTPGGAVVVTPGAFGILNTYPGQTSQTYMGRAISDTNLAIAATGGSIRSDMIIARIDDPFYGGSTPPSIPDGPYVKLEVLSNVGAGATALPGSVTYPAIILARIDIPASTSIITNAMIVNLRSLIRPRKERTVLTYQGTSTRVMSDVYTNWPQTIGWNVPVPSWATQVVLIGLMGGVKFKLPNGSGSTLIRFGTDSHLVETQYTSFNTIDTGGYSKATLMTAGTLVVPPTYRGTTQNIAIRGAMLPGFTTDQRATVDDGSTTVLDLEFIEVTV